MIAIIDYGMGNLGSIQNMLKRIGAPSIITSNVDEIYSADKVILPGVGSFDAAMQNLEKLNLIKPIKDMVLNKKKPILGICLGMQILLNGSEEGNCAGLGLINGQVFHFKGRLDSSYKVPHMGWNIVSHHTSSRLSDHYNGEIRFYFVHSYFAKVVEAKNSMFKCNYGIDFDAAIHLNNIFGAQFHPEKSHRFGMQFLQNFAEI